MGSKDLHAKPFDEGTIAKLEIFEAYTKAFVSIFSVMMKPWPWAQEYHIYDFFAGTGYDKDGTPGSPIRILQQLEAQEEPLRKRNKKVFFLANELHQRKFRILEQSCNDYIHGSERLSSLVENRNLEINFENDSFENLFQKFKDRIQYTPSLVFIDQNGVEFLNDKYLKFFLETRGTDFLYFASSSYIKRFGKTPEFTKHLNFNLDIINNANQNFAHQALCDALRKKAREEFPDTKIYLYPFSIKKGKNVYGIIFGTHHELGIDKFLEVAWSHNTLNGEANFDLYEDSPQSQLNLFSNEVLNIISKKEKFERDVAQKILEGELSDNKKLLMFAHENGHPGSHASKVVQRLKSLGKIACGGHAKVSYNAVYRNKEIVEYKVLKQK